MATAAARRPDTGAMVAALMATGGDARILLDPRTGLNRYHSAPLPRDVLAYASSTANDISAAAFDHVDAKNRRIAGEGIFSGAAYAAELDRLRERIRRAYGIADNVSIVFAPSGTDLEYVGLACAAGRDAGGVFNMLLGADEVGSGCIHSANGQYFADATSLGVATRPGEPVPGLGNLVDLVDISVRDADGRAHSSAEIADLMRPALERARAMCRHPLVHVVHGSKTGLILPSLLDLARMREKLGEDVSLVVDACQARITPQAVADYLALDSIVFVTGSKFMGGPPFSGFALVPPAVAAAAAPLPNGFATLFRRGEWPRSWPGAEHLPDSANLGLLLRLEASVFELERFQLLGPDAVERVIDSFQRQVRGLVDRLGVAILAPFSPGEGTESLSHPIEMRTLVTLDLSGMSNEASLEDALAWHRGLVTRGIRVGQPVKCVRLPDGRWGATLRIGLSMPMIVERVALDDDALESSFERDMIRIGDALAACAADD